MFFLKKLKLKHFLLIILIITLVFLGGGLFLFKVFQPKKIEIQKSEPEKAQPKEESIEPLDTTNWQVYQNKNYGFEFRYPPEWKFKKIEENILVQEGIELFSFYESDAVSMGQFGIFKKESNVDFLDWIKENIQDPEIENLIIEEKDIIVDKSKALKRIYKVKEINVVVAVFIFFLDKNNQNVIYYFTAQGSDNILVLENIISTFRFLK